MDEEIKEYVNHYSTNPNILTKSEIKQIEKYRDRGDLNYVEFNKKGHLVFRQRYPDFPIYFSIIALFINIIILAYIIIKTYIYK